MVVNHAQPASTAFATARVRPAHFSKPPGARHQIPEFGASRQLGLHFPVFVIVQIVRQVTRKCRRFNKLHIGFGTRSEYAPNYTPLAYVMQRSL